MCVGQQRNLGGWVKPAVTFPSHFLTKTTLSLPCGRPKGALFFVSPLLLPIFPHSPHHYPGNWINFQLNFGVKNCVKFNRNWCIFLLHLLGMFTYDSLLEVFKFLRQNDLAKLEWTNKWTRNLVEANRIYWPLNRCYRLTFLEYYAGNTLSRVPNLNDFPFQLKPILQRKLEQSELPANGRVPLFLDVTEPTFLLFEFSSGRKFYVEFEPFLDGQNMEKLIFWLDQIANVFFEEEIRGLLDIRKFHPELLEWLNASGFGKLMHFRCKTFGCYEYEAFDQSSIKFVMDHMSVQCLDKANGTIYSPELVQFLHNGADCCQSFSTRWVMGCGPEFTDNLIQHALNTESPHKMVPSIRITPSSHRQRELPIPRSLVPSEKIWLIKREFGDWKYEEWEIENSGGGGQMPAIRFRLCLFLFDDLETDEQAISQFSIKRI